TKDGLRIVTDSYVDLPSITINIIWLLIESFTTVTLDMDYAPHVEYSDVVPCGVFAGINSYPMDGLATISNSMTLLRNLNYKQTRQMSTIWNGSHMSILLMGEMDMDTCMVYLLTIRLN